MSELSIDSLIDLGIAAQNNGNLRLAEELYRQGLQLEPNDPDALHLLGLILHNTRREAEAIDLLTAAVAAAPDDPIFHFNLAEALRASNRHEEAARHYAQALSLDGALVQCHLPFAESLAATGAKKEARPQLASALQHAATTAELLRLATCAASIDCQDLASAVTDRLLKNPPTDMAGLQALSQVLTKLLRFEQLIDVYQSLLALEAREGFYVGLASAYAELKNYEAASNAAAEAIARFPAVPGAHYIAGFCAGQPAEITPASAIHGTICRFWNWIRDHLPWRRESRGGTAEFREIGRIPRTAGNSPRKITKEL